MIQFTVNGKAASTDAPPVTPLLWIIREGLKLDGTKFGCGAGLCGACMVHIDGKRAFSCQTQVIEVSGRAVTTIEGLSAELLAPGAEGLARRKSTAMRLLPIRPDHERRRSPQAKSASDARRDCRTYERAHLPLRDLSAHRARDRTRRAGGLSHEQDHVRRRSSDCRAAVHDRRRRVDLRDSRFARPLGRGRHSGKRNDRQER